MPKNSAKEEFVQPREEKVSLKSVGSFDYDSFINSRKIPIVIALIGLIFLGFGVFLYKNTEIFKSDTIEIVTEPQTDQVKDRKIVVEVAGSVEKPGVYNFKEGDRIEDLMIICGGLSASADREWVEKFVNRAAKLSDGQKIYIKSVGEDQKTDGSQQFFNLTDNNNGGYQSGSVVLGTDNSGSTNINTATLTELDKLPGIGQVYGQKIIEQRPYSDISELLSKNVLPKSTYEKIKEKISVY